MFVNVKEKCSDSLYRLVHKSSLFVTDIGTFTMIQSLKFYC